MFYESINWQKKKNVFRTKKKKDIWPAQLLYGFKIPYLKSLNYDFISVYFEGFLLPPCFYHMKQQKTRSRHGATSGL